jgi:hypothetical protein
MKNFKIKTSRKARKTILLIVIPIISLFTLLVFFFLLKPRDSLVLNVTSNSAEVYLKTKLKPILKVDDTWDSEISNDYVEDYKLWVSKISINNLEPDTKYSFKYGYNFLFSIKDLEFNTKQVADDVQAPEVETGIMSTSSYVLVDTDEYDLLIRTNPESDMWAFDKNRIDLKEYTIRNYLKLENILTRSNWLENIIGNFRKVASSVNAQAQDECEASVPPQSPDDEFCQASRGSPRTIESGKRRLLEDFFLYSTKKDVINGENMESRIDIYGEQDIQDLLEYIGIAIDGSDVADYYSYSSRLKTLLTDLEEIANIQGTLDCQYHWDERGYNSWSECSSNNRREANTAFYPDVDKGASVLPSMYNEWDNGNFKGYSSLFFLGMPDIICESVKAGMDPLWILTTWMHESSASDYGCANGSPGSCTIDFGGESVGGNLKMRFNSQLGYILFNGRHAMYWTIDEQEKNTPLVFWNWHRAAPYSAGDLSSSFNSYFDPVYGNSNMNTPVIIRYTDWIYNNGNEVKLGNGENARSYECGDTSAPHIYLESYDICANPLLAKTRDDLYNSQDLEEAYNEFMDGNDGWGSCDDGKKMGDFCTRSDGSTAMCDANGNCRTSIGAPCQAGPDAEGNNCIVNGKAGTCDDNFTCVPIESGNVPTFPLTYDECKKWGEILYEHGITVFPGEEDTSCSYDYLYNSCYGVIAYDSRFKAGGIGGYGDAGMVTDDSATKWDDYWNDDDDPPNQTDGYCCGIVGENDKLNKIIGDWEFDSNYYPGVCYDTWEVGTKRMEDVIAEVIELSVIPDSDTCQKNFEGVCCIKGSTAQWYPKEYCDIQLSDLDYAQCQEYKDKYDSINIPLEPGFNFITWDLQHPIQELSTKDVFDIDSNIILIASFENGAWENIVLKENGQIAGQHFELKPNTPYLFVSEDETTINIQGEVVKNAPDFTSKGWHFISPVIDGELQDFDGIKDFIGQTDYTFNQSAVFNHYNQTFEYYISEYNYNEHYDFIDFSHGIFVKVQ